MAYSDKDIQLAKDFLKTRLSAEKSSSHNLEEALLVAAQKIVDLCKQYHVNVADIMSVKNSAFIKALKEIISQLEDDLYRIVELLSEFSNEDDKDYIIAYINKEIYGMSLKTRIAGHISSFVKYLGAVITLGKGIVPDGKTSIISFGAGHSLDVLMRNTIARTYMEEWKLKHTGASGFYSFRGSSYPCATCDDYTGYHTIDEYALPLHPNCCCYAVFVYDE